MEHIYYLASYAFNTCFFLVLNTAYQYVSQYS